MKLQFKKIAPSRFFDVFENSILMLFRIYVPLCTLLNNATYALKIAFHRKERNAQRIGVPAPWIEPVEISSPEPLARDEPR